MIAENPKSKSPLLNAKALYALFLVLVSFVFAREPVNVIRVPQTYISLGGSGELRDDIYGADVNLAGGFAPCDCFEVYGDFSYRIFSFEYNTMFHDQIHEMLDLQVNGFNESYLGMKFMPYPFFGVDVSWRLPPGEGSQTNRFHRLGVEPFYVHDFSRGLQLGAAAGYFTFLESDDFLPGDELGLKGSMEWRLAWDYEKRSGWQFDYVFLYRWRLLESENLCLDKPYQKMNDQFRGFRMRADAARYISISSHSLGIALFYEMNRGYLFGFETGHSLGLYTKFVF